MGRSFLAKGACGMEWEGMQLARIHEGLSAAGLWVRGPDLEGF